MCVLHLAIIVGKASQPNTNYESSACVEKKNLRVFVG